MTTRRMAFRKELGLLLPLLPLLIGCGGGGGGHNTMSAVSGVVSDVDGQAVAGATVTVGRLATTSLGNGTFTFNSVGDGYQQVKASLTVNGHKYSGQTVIDVAVQNHTVNVMVSDERYQGSIGGRVIDSQGYGLAGAKVFVAGPISSTMGVADNSGYYQIDRLPSGVIYTVTASLAGYLNGEQSNVQVNTNSTTSASFALSTSSSLGTLPAPTNVQTQAWTIANDVTRATPVGRNITDWLKAHYRKQRNLPDGAQAENLQTVTATRSTPAGSVVEVDLFWDYAQYDDLFGYAIKRALSTNGQYKTVALFRDPLTTRYFDVDNALTPDTNYYYTVHRLSTIDFPADGTVGPASSVASADPLQPMHAVSPVNGNSASSTPTFQWTSVNGANEYRIYLWDSFPDLQYSSEADGKTPIWTSDSIGGTATSYQYTGAPLGSGTYYYTVVAADSGNYSLSSSQIAKFKIP